MMRDEYPRLLETEDARAVAAAVADPHELLYQLRRKEHLIANSAPPRNRLPITSPAI